MDIRKDKTMRQLLLILMGLLHLNANAHHSGSMFQFGTETRLEGKIISVRWRNPHVHFALEANDPDGVAIVWTIEGEPPAIMSKHGWNSQSIIPGDQVTFIVNPPRNPEKYMSKGLSVESANGELLWISGFTPYMELMKDPLEPVEASSLTGTWMTQFNPEVFESYYHRRPSASLTEKGNTALREYDELAHGGTGCTSSPAPYYILMPISTVIEIGNPLTKIRFEGDHGVIERTIYMNLDSHDGTNYSIQGHSIGQLEDNALIVDTRQFEVHDFGHARGLPSSREKHLIERFELNPGQTSLSYTFSVQDSEYLAETATATINLFHRPDLEFLDIPCDIESARQYWNVFTNN